jgi:hypothetical protein
MPEPDRPPIRVSRRAIATAIALLVAVQLLLGVSLVNDQTPSPITPAPAATPALTPSPSENPAAPAVPGAPAASSDELPGISEHVEHEIAAANENVTAGTYDTSGVLSGATAKPAHTSCYTPMNGGARTLSQIKLGVVHVTVSRNAPGLADGNALCSYFRTIQASPTWTVDNEGNSWENVPLERVPWTQAWYNRASCSIEFIGNTGRPGEGASEWTDAQLREGARLMAQCFVKAGIKPVRGAVTPAGAITRAGVVTHQELGIKGGGHTDPGPNFNMATFMHYLASAMKPITSVDRATCRKVNWWRAHGRPHGLPEKRAIRRRDALAARGVRCTSSGLALA